MRRPGALLLGVIGVSCLAGCGGGGRVQIAVDHPVALWDTPLRVAVSGLKPGEHALLRAKTGNWYGGRYASATSVTADSAGRVELTGDQAMRPLWDLRRVASARGGGSASPSALLVSLAIAGARTTIRRLLATPGVHGVAIRHPFYGEYYAPARTSTPRPGILIFGGSEGGLATTGIAQLYASHGYPSLALAYFAEPGLPRNLARIPLEYFASALRWLRRQPAVDSTKLAVEGISRGSEAAQLLGIHYHRLVHAVIAMVPGLGSGCGITRFTGNPGSVRCIGAAWTYHGKAIPWGDGLYNPFPFPDQQIDGPIFLDCGGLDALWQSCPMARAIIAHLHADHFHHKITFLDYPEAGHGVGPLVPNEPNPSPILSGLHADSNNRAAATGWPKLLHFLASEVGERAIP